MKQTKIEFAICIHWLELSSGTHFMPLVGPILKTDKNRTNKTSWSCLSLSQQKGNSTNNLKTKNVKPHRI